MLLDKGVDMAFEEYRDSKRDGVGQHPLGVLDAFEVVIALQC